MRLRRIGGIDDVHGPETIGMTTPWRYRNQVQVPVRFDGQGGVQLGFFQANSHQIVETNVCALEPEAMETMVETAARTLAAELGAERRKSSII